MPAPANKSLLVLFFRKGLLACLPLPVCAQILAVSSHGPDRAFGYFAGDLVTSTVDIATVPGTTLDAASLPIPGPVTASVDLRSVTVSASPGATTVRTTYQSFVAPEEVARADVPGYRLTFVRAGVRVPVGVPPFGFTVAPFRHDLQPVLDPAVLRPDHPPALAETAGPWRRLVAGLLVAGGSAGLLLSATAWSALVLPGGARPFAAAARRVTGRGAAPRDALLALHRAFDAAAGSRVLAGDVAAFVGARPSFRPLRREIEAFFDASHRTFFADAPPPPPATLARLVRDLSRAERRA